MDPILILIIMGILVILSVSLIIFGLTRIKEAETISDRLNQFTERVMTLEELELQQPFYQRVLVPMGRSILTTLGNYGPRQSSERLKRNLQQAGNPGGITPPMFIGLRVVLAILLFGIFAFVTFSTMDFSRAMLFSTIALVLGYMLPVIWLGRQIAKRKHNIVKALPDALDLITISVEAGLAFDSAIQRVTDKWDDELSKELSRVLTDVRLGRSRREALRDMAARTGVDDVQTFVAAIIQADQLGVPLAKILRIQSDQLRIRRRQRAEEAAQKAPIKMLFPMVFLIFPALFVVILGPAVPRIMSSLGSL